MVAGGRRSAQNPFAASPEPGRRGASASSRALRPHTGRAAQRAPGLGRSSPRPDALWVPAAPYPPPSGAGLRS
jgi:hypothetical protein